MEQENNREPQGFGEHTRKSSGENAHEQGWGLNEEERTRESRESGREGGTDYDYGARDFGDSPANTRAEGAPGKQGASSQDAPGKQETTARRPPASERGREPAAEPSKRNKNQRTSASRG